MTTKINGILIAASIIFCITATPSRAQTPKKIAEEVSQLSQNVKNYQFKIDSLEKESSWAREELNLKRLEVDSLVISVEGIMADSAHLLMLESKGEVLADSLSIVDAFYDSEEDPEIKNELKEKGDQLQKMISANDTELAVLQSERKFEIDLRKTRIETLDREISRLDDLIDQINVSKQQWNNRQNADNERIRFLFTEHSSVTSEIIENITSQNKNYLDSINSISLEFQNLDNELNALDSKYSELKIRQSFLDGIGLYFGPAFVYSASYNHAKYELVELRDSVFMTLGNSSRWVPEAMLNVRVPLNKFFKRSTNELASLMIGMNVFESFNPRVVDGVSLGVGFRPYAKVPADLVIGYSMRFNSKPINGLTGNGDRQMTSIETVDFLIENNIYVPNGHDINDFLTNQTEHALFISFVIPLDVISGVKSARDNLEN